MMKFSKLTLLAAFSIAQASAQDVAKSVTPFAGIDYVRLVVNAPKPGAQYKAVITGADHKILWQGAVMPTVDANKQSSYTIKNLKPHLWTPSDPYLYDLSFEQILKGKVVAQTKDRIGFRSITTANGHIMLNGKPLFLRGIAINPPSRGINPTLEKSREFAMDYVRYMKSINVNIIRIPNAENWYNVCDELGMMVFWR